MKIKVSIFLTVLAFAVIPLVILFSITIANDLQATEQLIETSMAITIDAQLGAFNKFYHDEKIDMASISLLPMTRKVLLGADDQCSNELSNWLKIRASIDSNIIKLSVLNADYQVLSSSDEIHDEVSLLSEFASLFDFTHDDLSIMDYKSTYVDSQGESHEIILSVFQVKEQGTVLGYLVKALNLSYFEQLRDSMSLWTNSTYHLLDGNNIVLAGGDENLSDPTKRSTFWEKLSQIDFDQVPKGNFLYEYEWETHLCQYSKIPFANWLLLLTINMDRHVEKGLTIMLLTLLVFLVAVLSLIMIHFSYRKKIVTPIQSTIKTLKEVRETNQYDKRIEVSNKDEIGEVADEVNILLDYVSAAMRKERDIHALLEQQAEIDELSGLYNKATTMRKIAARLEQDGKYALMVMDMDNFKSINDTLGHPYGDYVLSTFSKALKQICDSQVIVGRAGGDEFFVFMEYVHRQDVVAIADRIGSMFSSLFIQRPCSPHFSISIGIAVYPEDATDLQTLYHHADVALYRAKANGKSQMAWYHDHKSTGREPGHNNPSDNGPQLLIE